MSLPRWLQNLLITSALGLLLFCGAGPVNACVEGLVWGMPLEQVTAHLGEGQAVTEQRPVATSPVMCCWINFPFHRSPLKSTPQKA